MSRGKGDTLILSSLKLRYENYKSGKKKSCTFPHKEDFLFDPLRPMQLLQQLDNEH